MNDAPPPKLHHYRFAYEMEDGDTGTVTVTNTSLIAWDETRAKRQWPDQEAAPNLWQTFIVWHALTRTGGYKEDFGKFRDECVAMDMLNRHGESITAKALAQAFAQEEEDGEPHAPDIDPAEAVIPSDPILTTRPPG